MNNNPSQKFIFITPFLKEAKRVQKDCPELNFKTPSDDTKSKSAHLKDLLLREENIVSTHSLFTRVDLETLELLKMTGYTLILDEVMDIVHQLPISSNDLQMLEQSGFLVIDRDNGQVKATPEAEHYAGAFSDIIKHAQSGRLVCFNTTFLLWQFPPEVFAIFEQVYVLTYLFKGQIQRCYFDYHNIPYQLHSVIGSWKEGYTLIDQQLEEEFRAELKERLNIYEGPLNKVGEASLGYNWYLTNHRNKRIMKRLKDNTYNFYTNVVNGKSAENMWTTFNMAQDALKGTRYTKGFVTHNARATNEYGHKKNLAYLVNRYLPPSLIQYFGDKGVTINEELFAVSELIQWLFRSRLRNGQSVNLYIPSKRMRALLKKWLEGEL